MSVYDTDIIANKNASSTNCISVEHQNLSQPIIQPQQQENFFTSQGMPMEANFFTREENQFDRYRAVNTPFETNHHNNNNNNNINLMFGSSCDLTSFDFKEDLQLQGGGVGIDTLYKQPDVSIWYN
jgi:ethylene-insensitive protein 3